MRFLLPVIFILLAIGIFVGFVSPEYAQVQALETQAEAFDTALGNSKKLQVERDELTNRFNNFSDEDIRRIQKMVPDNVDNVLLIEEIRQVAASNGVSVTNVDFDPEQIQLEDEVIDPRADVRVQSREVVDNSLYETFLMEFEVQGSYADFVTLLELLETSLRIIDVYGIEFSSEKTVDDNPNSDFYSYRFTVKTYRLNI